jgi:biopolymer transport protein ExbD
MALSSRNKVNVAFSMSGMTDIVFLLLIFFMLTSTLINQNALKLLLPKSSNQTQASPHVQVSIDQNINYYFNERKVAFNELEALLQNELKFRVDPTVSIHADKSVDIEYVVGIMNIAKKHKYKVILATAPE